MVNSLASKTFIIGARGSLLSITQTTLIKQKLESLTGHKFEIKKISTQGDENTKLPLWQLDGKDFFTKELDHALLKNEVDLVIHSYKDLGSIRPEGIKLAAVTKRILPNDILLIKNETIKKYQSNPPSKFKIGTSSPRRITNLTNGIHNVIPFIKDSSEVECLMLRGNVNTRIEKLLNDDYDAIVLALAGIERLAQHADSKPIIEDLVKDLNYMILPCSQFPPAASQGALGIEINESRSDNSELQDILNLVHDQKTFESVAIEREIFNSYGGGCHLAVGINVQEKNNLKLHFIKGEVDGKKIDQSFQKPEIKINREETFIGLPCYDEKLIKKIPKSKKIETKDSNIFITSSYCFENLKLNYKENKLFAAGAKTMIKLSNQGFWVNISADSFGHEFLAEYLELNIVKLLNKTDKTLVFTHQDSKSPLGEVIGCYERELQETDPDFDSLVNNKKAFYWTSKSQFDAYTHKYPQIFDKLHYSGIGSTFDALSSSKINLKPIFNIGKLLN